MTAITVNDKIRGAARGTPAIAMSRVNHADAKDNEFARRVQTYAPQVFIDPAITISISGHETGMFESPRWNNDLNPGGIGIVSDSTGQPFKIPNADVAAMVLVSALNRLVEGRREEPWLSKMPAPAKTWLDTVWKRHCDHAPEVTTLKDMTIPYKYPGGDQAYTWAEDPDWPKGVVNRSVQLYGDSIKSQSSATKNDVVFGLVPTPGNFKRQLVTKGGSGNGYYLLPTARWIVGGVEHITAGEASIEWYQDFFGINGERARDALVDFIIDASGRIAMFNDPWGYRSPWANGSADGLEGDGPAFINKLGLNAVNDRLFSTEHVRRGNEAWPDAMFNATIELDAWMFDSAGVRWDAFPLHQQFNIRTHLFHSEFTGKGGNTPSECPGAWIKASENINRLQNSIRARMKKYQTGVESSGEVEPPTPQEPDVALPGGYTVARAAKAYGTMHKLRTDNQLVRNFFDPNNGLCLGWLQRAVAEGITPPRAVKMLEFNYNKAGDKGASASFDNGWIFVKESRRAGWRIVE